jgi:hypothetical protein
VPQECEQSTQSNRSQYPCLLRVVEQFGVEQRIFKLSVEGLDESVLQRLPDAMNNVLTRAFFS